MKVSLPYCRSRRYLTGIDWVVAVLDTLSRRTLGNGNAFQIVMDLRGGFDEARFRQAVESFVQHFPALGGHVARDWNLAPYWKSAPAGDRIPVLVESVSVPEPDLWQALSRSANSRFPDSRTHLAFRVFHVGEHRHAVAVQFDHKLFDATGAEHFLELFQRWWAGEDCRDRIARIALTEPAHLSEWMRKFELGKQFVRFLRGLAEFKPVILPRPEPLRGRPVKFAMIEFDAAESAAITARADREAGFMMFLPYTLAVSLEALAPVILARASGGEDFLISISMDLRNPETAPAQVFFNHVSFLFFQIPASVATDRKQLLALLRTQMYDQVKNGFPKALHESSMLMRIAPLGLLSRMILKPVRGELSSLGFTCVGKGGYALDQFAGATLANLVHMPLVPVPPGVGFFIGQLGGHLNAVLSYVEGMFSDDDVRRIQSEVKRLL